MKSTVCTKANEYIKQGYTRSDAFKKAWTLAKLETVNNKLFMLNMADRLVGEEKKRWDELRREAYQLQNRANAITVRLTQEHRDQIEEKMVSMLNSPNIDWSEYGKLERLLKGRVA